MLILSMAAAMPSLDSKRRHGRPGTLGGQYSNAIGISGDHIAAFKHCRRLPARLQSDYPAHQRRRRTGAARRHNGGNGIVVTSGESVAATANDITFNAQA